MGFLLVEKQSFDKLRNLISEMTADADELIPISKAAQILKVNPKTIKYRLSNGELSGIPEELDSGELKYRYVRKSSIEAFIRRHRESDGKKRGRKPKNPLELQA